MSMGLAHLIFPPIQHIERHLAPFEYRESGRVNMVVGQRRIFVLYLGVIYRTIRFTRRVRRLLNFTVKVRMLNRRGIAPPIIRMFSSTMVSRHGFSDNTRGGLLGGC